jgi:hypothetical protein
MILRWRGLPGRLRSVLACDANQLIDNDVGIILDPKACMPEARYSPHGHWSKPLAR